MARIILPRRLDPGERSYHRQYDDNTIIDCQITSFEFDTEILIGIVPVIHPDHVIRVRRELPDGYFIDNDGGLRPNFSASEMRKQGVESEYHRNSRVRATWGIVTVEITECKDNPEMAGEIFEGKDVERYMCFINIRFRNYQDGGTFADFYGRKKGSSLRVRFFSELRNTQWAQHETNIHPARTMLPLATAFGAFQRVLKIKDTRAASQGQRTDPTGGRFWGWDNDTKDELPDNMFEDLSLSPEEVSLVHIGIKEDLSGYRSFVPPAAIKEAVEHAGIDNYRMTPLLYPGARAFIHKAEGQWRFMFAMPCTWAPRDPGYLGGPAYYQLAYLVPVTVPVADCTSERRFTFRGLPLPQQQAIWEIKGMAQAMVRALNVLKGEILKAPADLERIPSDKKEFPKHHLVVSWSDPWSLSMNRGSPRSRYGEALRGDGKPLVSANHVARIMFERISANELLRAKHTKLLKPVSTDRVRALDL